ncbi:MAG: B12-binding domain-containing radical SAM protein [Candidatus Omnitrophica bacterium]|nr:B12-binding domain-containing radical SAM protein [Candidatus Omnitrophota bacterium]
MKIAFVAFGYENLGIEYLSSYLKEKGHETALVFDPALFKTYHLQNDFLAGIFNFRKNIVDKILAVHADVVAFSVLSDNYQWAKGIAEEVKHLRKDVVIVFGGIHPSSVPELVISEDAVDYVCVGESEEALAELVDALENMKDTVSIRNVWAKRDGVIFKNAPRDLIGNLDVLPLPDKDLFYAEYKGFTDNIYMTMTSRGCPYQCTYCYNSYLMELYADKGKYLRRFSVKRVIEELLLAKEKYGMKRIVFVDDVFISHPDWLEEFTGEYKKKIDLPFGCLVHPFFVNKRVVDLLKRAGCTSVGMGIQTLNEPLKKEVLGRFESNAVVEEAISLFKKANIFIYVDFIFGLPGESNDDVIKAALFLSKTRPDGVSTLWLRYYPKADIIRIAKIRNILSGADEERINQALASAPVSDFGNCETALDKKLVSFLLVSANLPVPVTRVLLKYKLFRLLPAGNLHHFHTLIKQAYNRVIHRKDGTLYSSLGAHLSYYGAYMRRYRGTSK